MGRAAGKETVGLALHWPRVTDISGSPPTAQGLGEGNEHPPTLSCAVW